MNLSPAWATLRVGCSRGCPSWMLFWSRCDFAFSSNVFPCTANTDWVHKAGYPRATLRFCSCAVECMLLFFFSLQREGVDRQFKDRLRHSQYTFRVIVVSTGLRRAEFMAWQANCLPLSELRAVTLWKVTNRHKKWQWRKKRLFGQICTANKFHHKYSSAVLEIIKKILYTDVHCKYHPAWVKVMTLNAYSAKGLQGF